MATTRKPYESPDRLLYVADRRPVGDLSLGRRLSVSLQLISMRPPDRNRFPHLVQLDARSIFPSFDARILRIAKIQWKIRTAGQQTAGRTASTCTTTACKWRPSVHVTYISMSLLCCDCEISTSQHSRGLAVEVSVCRSRYRLYCPNRSSKKA
jgi:hypothetical protein